MSRPDVYSYLDYRAYLRDLYADAKANGRLSYRAFSRRAALKSPNYLKLVIDGQRNLTPEMAQRFAAACNLRGESADFFCSLVSFNQATRPANRSEAYEKLATFKRYRRARRLELAEAAYHSTWYLVAIRELAARTDFKDDPAWVARELIPPISPADAARALSQLLELGLLVRGDDGKIVQGEPLVTTGPEVKRVHYANYHREMIGRAAASIDILPGAERDISSLTVCLGPEGIRRYKERIQAFRRELLELSTLEPDPEQVVQVNFQLFPLSRRRRPPEKES